LICVQSCVRNPEWEGRAPARRLLDWTIETRWERERGYYENGDGREKDGCTPMSTPVWLDTTIDYGVRAYEEIGFKVVGECFVKTGVDGMGIELGRGKRSKREKKRGESKQWSWSRRHD